MLLDLPAKIRTVVNVLLPKGTAETKAAAAAMKKLKDARSTSSALDDLPDFEAYDADSDVRRLVTTAYQATGIAKAPACADYLCEWLASTAEDNSKVRKGVSFPLFLLRLTNLCTPISTSCSCPFFLGPRLRPPQRSPRRDRALGHQVPQGR